MDRLKSQTKQRYLIAKFAADVRRMETRNIGVILWTPKGLGCKFLAEGAATTFVDDTKAYRRWVAFWTGVIEKPELVTRGWGKVLREQPEFLDVILDTQRGGYLLYDAGQVTDKINKRDIGKAVEFLFNELVNSPESVRRLESSGDQVSERFDRFCAKIFNEAGLASHKGFQVGRKIPCQIGGVHRDFPVNYSLFDEQNRPVALYQRVVLSDERSIDSTSFMFEKLRGTRQRGPRCASLYRPSTEPDPIPGAIDQLSQYCRMINADDVSSAIRDIDEVAFGLMTEQ